MIITSEKISTHFHSNEFKCKCGCGVIKIDEELVTKLEHIFDKLNASKCIVVSGYRCATYDVVVGGFKGRHYEGLAADVYYYDKEGNKIPSEIVVCAAYDLGELNGIAKISEYSTHLDNRKNGTYRGDEPRGNSSYWTNPYDYFGISKTDVEKYTGKITNEKKKTIDELVTEVLEGKWDVYPKRKKLLEQAGYNYHEVQIRVNELLKGKTTTNKKTIDELAKEVIAGKWGNGNERKEKLTKSGYNYGEVQKRVNELLK